MSVLGTLARTFFQDASWYRILRIDAPTDRSSVSPDSQVVLVQQEDIVRASCPEMRQQVQYAGDGARVYGYIKDSEIVGLCCYWFGERYLTRNFWPLQDGEAKLVQVITSPLMRNQGIAKDLIIDSANDMFARRFATLFARVWFSNKPSLRAFKSSGWRPIAHAFEFQTLRMRAPKKIIIGRR